MIEVAINNKVKELDEVHSSIKNIYGFDKFKLDTVIAILNDCVSSGYLDNSEELIKALEGLKKTLPDLDEKKIKESKEGLIKSIEGVKK